MASANLTAARLRELLHYDPATGLFTWRVTRGRTAKAGGLAGVKTTEGYIQVTIDGQGHQAHRLVFLHTTGEWPVGEVDHIDGVRDNNAQGNLRDVSKRTNSENRVCASVTNKVGLLGVEKHRNCERYRATIRSKGRLYRAGWFDTPEIAHAVYVQMKRLLHEGCTI